MILNYLIYTQIRAYSVAPSYRNCHCLQVLDLEQSLHKRKELNTAENLNTTNIPSKVGDPGIGVIALAVVNPLNSETPINEQNDEVTKAEIAYTSVIK